MPDRTNHAYHTANSTGLSKYRDLIVARRAEIVCHFYHELSKRGLLILDELPAVERAHLVSSQVAYLEQMALPDLPEIEHRAIASKVGEIYNLVSVSPASLVDASQIYVQSILHHLPEMQTDAQSLLSLQQRFESNLSCQLNAFWHIADQRIKILSEIGQHLELKANVADLMQQFVATAFEGKKTLCGVSLFNVQNAGSPALEYGEGEFSGTVLLDQYSTLFNVQHTLQPAWLSRIPMGKIGLSTPKKGAIAALPIFRDHGTVDRILVLCSHYPNYFGAEDKRLFFMLLTHELAMSLNRLRQTSGLHCPTKPERAHYLDIFKQNRIEMVFQPIVNVAHREIVKFEALARLVDDDGRLIAPGLFLPAFGARHLLDLFLGGLGQACAFIRKRPAGQRYGVSVNLPVESFEYPAILDKIMGVINEYAIDPGDITLEVLESSVNTDTAVSHLHRLRNSGLRIALDDVGSGESSLLRLNMIDVDEIKIDQFLCRNLCSEPHKLTVVFMLIQLAAQRGMHCVVEGVENDTILDMVKTLGGASIQGYGICRPIRIADALAWVDQFVKKRADEPASGGSPASLHGWYAKHLSRLMLMLNAIPNNLDLIGLERAGDANRCPLAVILAAQNMQDTPIYRSHKRWHDIVHEISQLKPDQLTQLDALKKELVQVTADIGETIQGSLAAGSLI